MVYKFFDEKTGWRISASEQSAEKLHKTVIENFYRRKFYARFKDNILAAFLAEMESFEMDLKWNVSYMFSLSMHVFNL